MSGSLCNAACGHCGRCNAPEDEDPAGLTTDDDNGPDCPTCGAKVEGQWAVLNVVVQSFSYQGEWEPRCRHCVGHSARLRRELSDALERD